MKTTTEQVIWTGLRSEFCRRRKCFIETTGRYHEYRSDGSAATAFGGRENKPHLPVTKTRVFKTCGRRRYGCPERFTAGGVG